VLAGQAIVATDLDVIIWGGSAFLVAAAAAAMALPVSRPITRTLTDAGNGSSLRALLRLREFRLLVIIAALVLGSHAMHDSFAMIRWKEAGISPPTASVLWSESVAAEVVVFVIIGPRLLNRIGPSRAMMLAAIAGTVRWSVMALTADLTAMSLIEPLPRIELRPATSCLHAPARRYGPAGPRRDGAGDLRNGRDWSDDNAADSGVRHALRAVCCGGILGDGGVVPVRYAVHRADGCAPLQEG
jgi:hypothetical protein